ncbi:uncharacterized protein LOC144453489 [Glandiceps talaboti]
MWATMSRRPCTSMLAGMIILLVHLANGVWGSLYDPHVVPNNDIFVEGWYTRLIDPETKHSFGLLFGNVFSSSQLEYSPTYLAFLHSDDYEHSMQKIEVFPDKYNITRSVMGDKQVTKDPDFSSPAYFSWVAEPFGYFNVTNDATVFDFTLPDVRFRAQIGPPLPWGENGLGPAGYLDVLPLPVHWYVYSLGSIGTYEWTNLTSSEVIKGKVIVHQEKNWGKGFPPSWIWSQAINDTTNVAFAGSFGDLTFLSVTVPSHLIGYRNYRTGLSMSFTPANSSAKWRVNGCNGVVTLVMHSLRYKVNLELSTEPVTLQKCLLGPTEEGFAPVCVESYVAKMSIEIYQLTWKGYEMIDQQYFSRAALEFGRNFLCSTKNPCMSSTFSQP